MCWDILNRFFRRRIRTLARIRTRTHPDRTCLPVGLALICLLALGACHARSEEITLLGSRPVHLGQPDRPEYDVFANPATPPQKPPFELPFKAASNSSEWTLFIRQDDVKENWAVELNGRRLGQLFAMEAPVRHTLTVPAGALMDGDNLLRLVPPKAVDNIGVSDIRLRSGPPSETINQGILEISVTDGNSGKPLPCRLTIVDETGALISLISLTAPADSNTLQAIRPGVVYTANGRARVGVPQGPLTIHATRGFEFGLDTKTVLVAPGQTLPVSLAIRREVDTEGWVACDTHTHTFTFSRHGDATLEERVITLAGEGIELPVATDHNTLTDYSDAARATGTSPFFTPIIGDEVTTRQAHFNVFPVMAGSRVPDFRILDWPKLFENIRGTPGVQVIVMNHPMNVHNAFQPFAATHFNSISGEFLETLDFNIDAMELINSSAMQSDMMTVYQGWFALLNAGHKITGVGSSDGHDVSRYIIGQGRTYIRCDDTDPGNINVNTACQHLKTGRALVSMGLLADLVVDGTARAGDLVLPSESTLSVTLTVQGPTWTQADHVALYANGRLIREQPVPPSTAPGIKARVTWSLPKPGHDIHLVALATGPGVTGPYWAIPRPYQPSSTAWTPRVVGSTNPIWIDGDGDKMFTSAKAYAEQLMTDNGSDPQAIVSALEDAQFDAAVAIQAAAICRAKGLDPRSVAFQSVLSRAAAPIREGFRAYADTIPD